MSPGSAYLGPGLRNWAEMGPLGLCGLHVPTQESEVGITFRERWNVEKKHSFNLVALLSQILCNGSHVNKISNIGINIMEIINST